jgi:3-methyladenine DNA glycosylase AlkC
MELITAEVEKLILSEIINKIDKNNFKQACAGTDAVIKKLYESIPANKRISYGIVHTVKITGDYLFRHYENGSGLFEKFSALYDFSGDSNCKTVFLCVISFYGLSDPESVFKIFEMAAADVDWQVREVSQMLFRKIIKKHPGKSRNFLLRLVKSADSNLRRFAGETMRPVCENKWFYDNPEYSLSVIRHLFYEKKPYPRTSAGNNLSDLARRLPDLVYGIARELVESGDKNAYWIAYRACRNLVKKNPAKVFEILKTDSYKYKDRIHNLADIND